ncbi:hypothetical protein ACTZO3_18325, partial [Klebsiella pneumoniae]
SSSIVMLMSVISTHYDLSRISVGHYITVTVALHKVSLTYRTCFQPATAFEQDRNVHHNLLSLI